MPKLSKELFSDNYLNQNLEGKDIPPENLITAKDNESEYIISEPTRIHNGKWCYTWYEKGNPYPCMECWESEEKARGAFECLLSRLSR